MIKQFTPGDIIYPIKKSNAYNMTQLRKLNKAEVISTRNGGKIAKVRIIDLKEPINPNKDGSPINSMLSTAFSVNNSITLNCGDEIEVFVKDFYNKTNSKDDKFCEFGKYSSIFYLEIIQNTLK